MMKVRIAKLLILYCVKCSHEQKKSQTVKLLTKKLFQSLERVTIENAKIMYNKWGHKQKQTNSVAFSPQANYTD
jgi:hypothetical protein